MGDWHYIGHYGQLGPLTREQIDELVVGGVIARDTYVWRPGMTDWIAADQCFELQSAFQMAAPYAEPPPRPAPPDLAPKRQPTPQPYGTSVATYSGYQPLFAGPKSDRSRMAAGILQIIIPGVGRMYLGYLAYGVLQLVLTVVTCGLLWVWSFIDGIIILTGGVKLDGFGRPLSD